MAYILNSFSSSIPWDGKTNCEILIQYTILSPNYKILITDSSFIKGGYVFSFPSGLVTITIQFAYESSTQKLNILSVKNSLNVSGSGYFCPGKYNTGINNDTNPSGLKFYNNQILPNLTECSKFYTFCDNNYDLGLNTNEMYAGGNLIPWPNTSYTKSYFYVSSGSIKISYTLNEVNTVNVLFKLKDFNIPVDGNFHSYNVPAEYSLTGIESTEKEVSINLRLYSTGKLDFQYLNNSTQEAIDAVTHKTCSYDLVGSVTVNYIPFTFQNNTQVNGDLHVTGRIYIEEL